MCAINGFNFEDENLARRMNETNAHRGPDGNGVFVAGGISFGHNRLSIIDLTEAARQPMTGRNGVHTIVFNGEIYNYRELREELRGAYPFRSKSDTEVILAAYERWGHECVKRLNGIFAFAIWDSSKREILLARDRVGVKPLYYFWDGTKFIFSSEMKSIFVHDVPRAVDRDAFNLYFHVLYVPEPYTMLSSVRKLPAAHYAILRGRSFSVVRYWAVENTDDIASRAEAEAEVRRLFDDSVKRQLISDRPVGVFLSGGMDSTAVVGAVRKYAGKRPKTFSVGFDVPGEEEKFNADFLAARKTAAYYGTDHHELIIAARDIAAQAETIAWHLDEPNFNPTAGAIFLLAKETKKEVAVVLGGDGGDELFGGYPRYYLSRIISGWQRMPRAVRRLGGAALRGFGKSRWAEKFGIQSGAGRVLAFLSEKEKTLADIIGETAATPDFTREYFSERYFRGSNGYEGDFEKRFMDIDRRSWLVDESLLRTDKMTMAWGLEERVPILDHRLVEIANRIPTAWKIRMRAIHPARFQGKWIWKRAIGEYLPPHVRKGRKRGWFTPMAKWLRGPLRGIVSDALSPRNLHPDFFRAAGIEQMWRDHVSGARYNLNLIWAVFMWQLWYNRFVKRNPAKP